MKKTAYCIISALLTIVSLYFTLMLWLGWRDYKCWFHPGASFTTNLRQFLNDYNSHAVIDLVVLLISIFIHIILAIVYRRTQKN